MQIGGSTVPGRQLKVAILIDSIARPGGGETIALETALRLDPERFERVLCVTRWEDRPGDEATRALVERLRDSGVRILPLRRSSRLSLWAWAPLVRLLRGERFDVIHGHMFGSNVWAVVIGRLCRVPVVVAHEHMWSYEGGRARGLIDRGLIARGSDAFVAVSEAGRRLMTEREGIPPEDIVLIRNGVPESPPGDGPRTRRLLGVGPDAPVVVSVGHLRHEKAYEVLIDAAALLKAEHPELLILIAGEGEERAGLESRIESLGLGENVRLLGRREDVPDLLAASDVAVCCSDFEGGPLSVMEYMRAGLPVIATDVGGLPELVVDGQTGALVPPRDPKTLAASLRGLLAGPGLRESMGRRGSEEFAERWSIDQSIREVEALYSRLSQKQ